MLVAGDGENECVVLMGEAAKLTGFIGDRGALVFCSSGDILASDSFGLSNAEQTIEKKMKLVK